MFDDSFKIKINLALRSGDGSAAPSMAPHASTIEICPAFYVRNRTCV